MTMVQTQHLPQYESKTMDVENDNDSCYSEHEVDNPINVDISR